MIIILTKFINKGANVLTMKQLNEAFTRKYIDIHAWDFYSERLCEAILSFTKDPNTSDQSLGMTYGIK